MKKLVCILLAAAIMLTLGACGDERNAADAVLGGLETGKSAPSAEQSAPAETEALAPEEEPAAEEELDAVEVLGEKDDNSYANRALKIRATLPKNWVIFSEEQIAQIYGYVADITSSEALAELLRKSGTLCDLYAAADNGTDNLNIAIQALSAVQGGWISEERYLELSVPQVSEAFRQMGMQDVTTEKGSCVFAGAEHCSLLVSAKNGEIRFYERMVLLKAGNYMGVVTAASQDKDRLDDILGFFEAYSG